MDQSIGVFMQRVFFMSLLTINIFLESREEFFEKLDSGVKIATSQPSPTEVMKLWDKGLQQFEQIVSALGQRPF